MGAAVCHTGEFHIRIQKGLQLTQSQFGGDPSHVVLSGDSAGGNAIDLLISANGGTGFPDLFVGAAAESTSWGAESQVVDLDANFAANVRATGCESASNVIDCMRTIPIDIFQNQTMGGWGPVIDGTLITAPHYQLYEQGRFQKIPVIHGCKYCIPHWTDS